MSELTLEIAIPFYEGLPYLQSAIESVLGQETNAWRLLVCDDGERDQGAGELVRSYNDDRLTYLRNATRLGIVGNWNHCLDVAQGDLVTLLHGDDRLLPGYAHLALGLAERNPEAVAFFCAAAIIGDKGEPRFSFADAAKRLFVPPGEEIALRGESGVARLMAGNFIMCPTLSFRRSVLGDRRFDGHWRQVQDLELTTRLLMDGDTLAGSQRVAYAYRRHGASATARQSESLLRFDEEFELFALVAERCRARGWERAATVSRRAWIVKLHLLYRSLGQLLRLRPGAAAAALEAVVRGPRKGREQA